MDVLEKCDDIISAYCKAENEGYCSAEDGKHCTGQSVFDGVFWFAEAHSYDKDVGGDGDAYRFGYCEDYQSEEAEAGFSPCDYPVVDASVDLPFGYGRFFELFDLVDIDFFFVLGSMFLQKYFLESIKKLKLKIKKYRLRSTVFRLPRGIAPALTLGLFFIRHLSMPGFHYPLTDVRGWPCCLGYTLLFLSLLYFNVLLINRLV